jgi:uncharacterized protein (TIGR02145 family)
VPNLIYNGVTYSTVVIDGLEWTVENLRTTKYNDGVTDIPIVTDSVEWSSLSTGACCFYNNTVDLLEQNKWGALYNGYAVDTGNLAPVGWRVPTADDWLALQTYLGGGSSAGGKLKTVGVSPASDWIFSNVGATNETMFSAIPSGRRTFSGSYEYRGYYCYFWSSTLHSTYNLTTKSLSFDSASFSTGEWHKLFGLSVRLVRDYVPDVPPVSDSWFVDLNASNSLEQNSEDTPFSATQFFDLLQGSSVNGESASDTDIFYVKGYCYDPSLVRDSLYQVSIRAWDLLRYGPWVIDSPLEFDMGLVDFSGGVITLNSPDLCSLGSLTNVMLVAQDTSNNFTLTGSRSEGCTLICKGTVGTVFNSPEHTFKDCTVICENPLASSVSTTVNVENFITNLVSGSGGSGFYGGSNILEGTSEVTQYGWTAPSFSSLPYIGNVPSTRDVSTLLSEKILITPQSVSASVPNYTLGSTTVTLSSVAHALYEQGLHGEVREVDSGVNSSRKYASNGIGAWWFSQEDLEIDDIRSVVEEGLFTAFAGGSFYLRSSDQSSALFRSGSLYKNTTTFPSFSSSIITSPLDPEKPYPYFSKANFSVWVRYATVGVRLLDITDSTGSISYASIEVTGSNQLTASVSNVISFPQDITDSTWHLITVSVDQRTNDRFVKVYFDKSSVSVADFKFELTSTGTGYRIYMPKVESAGKVIEISKPRFAITQGTLTDRTVRSIYDQEVGGLPV